MKKQKSVLAVLGSIVLVSAFLIVACGSGNRSEPPQSTSQPPQEQGPETSTPAQEVPTPRFYKVGEVVTIPGAVKITVTQAKRMPFSQADPGYSPEKGWPKNGSFLVLSVTMTNLGSQPLSVTGFDYGMRDTEGNTFPIWIWGVQGTDGLPTGTAPQGQKIKGDVTYIITPPVHSYYFSFEGKTPIPLFWQIE